MARFLLSGSVLLSALAWAQRPEAPVDCDDNFAECKEDCTISYGGTTNDKARAKINSCLKKCSSTELECRERFFETKRNNLDEGSLKDSPGSGAEDSEGMPLKKGKKRDESRPKVTEAPPPRDHDSDLRDERPREEPAPAPKAEKKQAEPPPAELRPEETPRSNRTQLSKVDPKSEPKKVEEAAPPRREEAPPSREEPKKASEREVREDEKPAPKKAEKRDEPKKKGKALDEWDPDAL